MFSQACNRKNFYFNPFQPKWIYCGNRLLDLVKKKKVVGAEFGLNNFYTECTHPFHMGKVTWIFTSVTKVTLSTIALVFWLAVFVTNKFLRGRGSSCPPFNFSFRYWMLNNCCLTRYTLSVEKVNNLDLVSVYSISYLGRQHIMYLLCVFVWLWNT